MYTLSEQWSLEGVAKLQNTQSASLMVSSWTTIPQHQVTHSVITEIISTGSTSCVGSFAARWNAQVHNGSTVWAGWVIYYLVLRPEHERHTQALSLGFFPSATCVPSTPRKNGKKRRARQRRTDPPSLSDGPMQESGNNVELVSIVRPFPRNESAPGEKDPPRDVFGVAHSLQRIFGMGSVVGGEPPLLEVTASACHH
jgi:hypothetical protein